MSYRDFPGNRPDFWARLFFTALGLGLSEAGFIFAARRGMLGAGFGILPLMAALVVLRFFFQFRLASAEANAAARGISGLRARLLEVLRTRAVPAYRAGNRRVLVRALEETVPRAGEGFLAHVRFLAAAAQAAILLPCLFLLSWRMALLSLPLALPAFWAARRRGHSLRILERAEIQGREQGHAALEVFGDGLETSGEIGLDMASKNLAADLEQAQKPETQWRMASAHYSALLEAGFFFALVALVLAADRFAALRGWEPWLIFSGLLLLVYRPLREAARHAPLRLQGLQAMQDLGELLRDWESRSARALPDVRKNEPGKDALFLENVSFAYVPNRLVFENLRAAFDFHAVTGITGPNGAGKTTLLRLLAGIERPDSGSVFWPEPLRDHGGVAYLPQRVFVGPDGAEWARRLRREAPARWEELDRLLGLSRLVEKECHPDAYSGGERQRLALGRALASDAPFLMLDEPTSALPGDEREKILVGALRFWKRGAVVASHEPFLGSLCDSLFVLSAPTPAENRKRA